MPDAVLAALPAARRPARADWSPDGGRTWIPARVGAAQISPDRTAECRYSGSADLLDVPVGGRDGINTVVTQVRLFQGIQGPRMDTPYWVPAGRYVVDGVSRTRLGAQVALLGLEDVIRTAGFPAARTIGPGIARTIVPELIAEALPSAVVGWRAGVDPGADVPRFVVDADRWAALSTGTDTTGVGTGIASALGGEIYADATGAIAIGPVPTLADPVVWQIPYGKAVVETAETQSAEGLVNLWVVSGDGGDGTPVVGPVHVWDDDPNSLTYAGPDPVDDPLAPQRLGLTGVRVRVGRHTSPLITTTAQADTVGRALLADSLGIQASLSFTTLCNPALEPGDVVEVEVEPDRWERHIIDSCPYTLGSAAMSCTTRTTARRLL
ncbi:phage tail protein [Streptomyces sp. NPDC102283]|uniref:phage tail protein n=1 Tax=Streptomyces sp. NPDC102283 TaxID=3366155 RepID=UPI003809EF8B